MFQCPFHGKIIPRDNTGKPSNHEDRQAEEERLQLEEANKVPDWQDPKLLAELKVGGLSLIFIYSLYRKIQVIFTVDFL